MAEEDIQNNINGVTQCKKDIPCNNSGNHRFYIHNTNLHKIHNVRYCLNKEESQNHACCKQIMSKITVCYFYYSLTNLTSISNPPFSISNTPVPAVWVVSWEFRGANTAKSIQWLGYELDDSGFLFWQVQKIFLSSKIFSPALGRTQTCIQWAVGVLSWR